MKQRKPNVKIVIKKLEEDLVKNRADVKPYRFLDGIYKLETKEDGIHKPSQ